MIALRKMIQNAFSQTFNIENKDIQTLIERYLTT